MKSKSEVLLNKAWWKREAPKAIEKSSGKGFLEAIELFEKTNAALLKTFKPKELEAFEKALVAVEKAGAEVAKEVARLARETKDSKEKLDLENTATVMAAPLARELDNARRSVETEEEDAPPSNFGTPEEHGKYLNRFAGRLKKGAYCFAVVVPGSEAADVRLAFHRSKDGRSLAKVLKDAGKTGKFTWGVAAAESQQAELREGGGEQQQEEGASARTLVLALDGVPIPGLARKIKLMFKEAKFTAFGRVKLLVDGQEVETDETAEKEASKDDGPQVPVGGEPLEATHPLWGSLQQLKAQLLPLVGPAALKYPDRKAELEKLQRAVELAEKGGKYDLAIAVLRDRLLPALRSAGRKPGGDDDIAVIKPVPSPTAQKRDVVSQSLAKVLDKTLGPPDKGFFSCFGGDGAPTSGKQFFDGVKVKFPKNATPPHAELLRDWSINMAMLQHLATTVPPDSPQHKALMNRTVGYLLKFANIPNTDELGWQSNPVQKEKTGTYHRSGGGRITEAVTRMTAKTLGVPEANCQLVSDRRVLEEVRRNFASEGELEAVDGWGDDDYDRVLRKALAGEEVFIDASGEIKSAVENKETAQNAAERIIVKLKERAWANATAGRGRPGLTETQLEALGTEGDRSTMNPGQIAADKKRVSEEIALRDAIRRDHELALKNLGSVRVGGVMAVGDQHALTMFPFSRDAEEGSKDALELSPADSERLRGLVGHSGLTAGPEQLLDHWVGQTPNVAEILRELGVTDLPKVEFPKGKKLDTFGDLREDFLKDPVVKDFAALKDEGDPPAPYVKVTVEALLGMVNGLEYGGRGASVKSCLETAGLGAMWALSLNKIQSLMAKAKAHKGSMRAFLDQTALIQEEIANLIAVAQPYTNKDFALGMKESTDMFPDNFLDDEGISAEFTLKNSASRCFNSVLTACEDMKERAQAGSGKEARQMGLAKRGLEVLVQGDSYYEPSMYVLEHAREHRQTGLNTDGLQKGGRRKDFNEQLLKLQKAQQEEGRGKLDSYLCEFHHNISYGREKYGAEDVTRQVRKLVKSGVVANPFTVAIDTTIAKTDEQAVKDFLAEFKQEIKDGLMNVAIYRSAQKFDQMGGDSYNGGVMCVVSAKTKDGPSPFQRALDGGGELPSEQNLQGLAHLNLSAQGEINAYRTAIMENTRRIGDPKSGSKAAIPKTMLLTDENKDRSLLQIAVNDDPEAPFLDIKFPFVRIEDEPPKPSKAWDVWNGRMQRYEKLYADMQKLYAAQTAADPEQTVSSTRASFGFQHSNLTLIGPVKLRLNPGLEDEDRLKGLTDTLVDMNDVMMTLKDDLQREGGIDPEQLEMLAQEGNLIGMPVLEAHRQLKKMLADRQASDKQKDEARLKMVKALCTRPQCCANPPGVLRLLGEMSGEFRQKHKSVIDPLRLQAELTLDAVKSDTPDQRRLKEAKAEMNAGRVLKAEARLGDIAQPFADKTPEKGSYDTIRKWIDDNKAGWDPAGEKAIETAEAMRKANDPIGVHEVLKYAFTKEFVALRGSVIDGLRDWAQEAYVTRNGKVAGELLALAQARIEQGDAGDALPYLVELERMKAKGLPGLPDKLDDQVGALRRAAATADARRYVGETLAKALDYEAVGNKAEVAKRVGWVDAVLKATKDAATVQQQGEVERLRLYARG